MKDLGVSINGGTPSHHPFEWDFPLETIQLLPFGALSALDFWMTCREFVGVEMIPSLLDAELHWITGGTGDGNIGLANADAGLVGAVSHLVDRLSFQDPGDRSR